MANPKEILITRGDTFTMEFRWGTEVLTYLPITAISLASGPPRLTVSAHGIPDRWPVAVTRVGGMKQINAENSPPDDDDYHEIRVIDANTIEFNGMDATGFSAYTSGGFVQFRTPQDLTGYTARMDVKDKIGGTVLFSSEVDADPLDIITLAVDAAAFKTTATISATDTAAITAKAGVTNLEMVSPTGVVTKTKGCIGKKEDPDPVRVVGEVTT